MNSFGEKIDSLGKKFGSFGEKIDSRGKKSRLLVKIRRFGDKKWPLLISKTRQRGKVHAGGLF